MGNQSLSRAILFDIESRRNRSGKAFLVQRDKREFIGSFDGLKDVSAIVEMVWEVLLRQKTTKVNAKSNHPHKLPEPFHCSYVIQKTHVHYENHHFPRNNYFT